MAAVEIETDAVEKEVEGDEGGRPDGGVVVIPTNKWNRSRKKKTRAVPSVVKY